AAIIFSVRAGSASTSVYCDGRPFTVGSQCGERPLSKSRGSPSYFPPPCVCSCPQKGHCLTVQSQTSGFLRPCVSGVASVTGSVGPVLDIGSGDARRQLAP